MLRFIGAAAVMALAAASPSIAQGKGHGGDHGAGAGKGGGDHAAMDHAHAKSGKDHADHRGKPEGAGKLPAPAARRDDHRERARGPEGDGRIRVIERAAANARDPENRFDRGPGFSAPRGCPPGLAMKDNGCLPPGLARQSRDRFFGFAHRPALFGIRLPARGDYAYYNGYLVPVSGSGLSYIPLLGGALAVGQVWPDAYPGLPLAGWHRDYYGLDDPRAYRLADNVVYRIDPETAAIEAVAALLTGDDFVVGGRLPPGYDIYNVPGPFQARYADSEEALYRYADGRVYRVDPVTMLIAEAIDLVV